MTQGLVQAGFQPIVSVEESSIASATHRKNFPQCHLFLMLRFYLQNYDNAIFYLIKD